MELFAFDAKNRPVELKMTYVYADTLEEACLKYRKRFPSGMTHIYQLQRYSNDPEDKDFPGFHYIGVLMGKSTIPSPHS